jgi:uncharacterized membrane protein YdjX (TVP38/TMEM64 family)
MITALTIALLVGAVVAGMVFGPSAGFATAAVGAGVAALLTVVDRRNSIRALARR